MGSADDEVGKHLKAVDDAIRELLELSPKTASPATVQFQYIGTTIDNTATLLTATANSLDYGNRTIRFSHFENWLSVMKSVHRSFYSSIVMSVEAGCVELCELNSLPVVSSRGLQAEGLINKALTQGIDLPNSFIKKIKNLGAGPPSSMDYILTVIDNCIEPPRRLCWINFFDALIIVRHKCSHFDVALTPQQLKTLNECGFQNLISDKNELTLNPRTYHQVCKFALTFFSEVEQNLR